MTINAAAAQQLLEASTGIGWRKVYPRDLGHYSWLKQTPVVYLCANKDCSRGNYFAADAVNPHRCYYRTVIDFATAQGYQLIPAIKCDLDKFPAVVLAPKPYLGSVLTLTLKFGGKLVLRPNHGLNPASYSIGGLTSMSSAAGIATQSYLHLWILKTIIPQDKHNLAINLTQVGSNESVSTSLTLFGNSFVGAIAPMPIKTHFKNWLIEGELSISLIGEISDPPSHFSAPITLSQRRIEYGSVTSLLIVGGFAGACILTHGAALALFGLGVVIP